MPVPISESDFTDLFNTQLTPEQEQAFQAWAALNPKLANTYDYDARGFFQSGAATAPNGHATDQFKKPNHPTFSDQSQYSGVEGATGGTWAQDPKTRKWTFVTSPTNELYHDPEDLQRYFDTVEKGNRLVYGTTDSER